MIVDKNTEYYLINSMGLNKKQIKDMLPSEIEKHCKEINNQRIEKYVISNTKKLKTKKTKKSQ